MSSADVWQYSRWVWVIARTMRINLPSAAELAIVESFIKFFWDESTKTGTRPWLQTRFIQNSIYPFKSAPSDPDIEPTYVDVKNLGVIARDLKKIPLTDAEAAQVDTLIAATGNRRYGDLGNLI